MIRITSKWLLSALTILILYNCTKQSNSQPSTPSSGSSGTTTSTMNPSELALVGKWFLKKKIAGTTTLYSSPNIYTQFNNVYTTDNSGTISVSGYTYTDSNTGIGAYTTWITKSAGDTLIFQSPSHGTINDTKWKINLCTTDSLILEQNNTTTGVYLCYFFHK